MFYGRDVAYVHDVGHRDFGRRAGEWLAGELDPPGLVVELGCGSGASAVPLAQAGFGIVGFDLSEELLGIARQRVPAGRFERASFLDAELPTGAAAITAFSEVLNYLADDRVDREALRALFARVREALRPAGVFVFDALESAVPQRGWTEGEDWLVCSDLSLDGHRFLRRVTTFVREGEGWRRADEHHHGALLPRDVLLDDLAAAGFADVRALPAYGEMTFRPGLTGYRALR